MKQYTEQEIREKAESIWNDDRRYSMAEIEITIHDDDRVDIKVYQQYDPPELNLDILMELAEFFDTRNINDDDRFSYSGCETCDYGSEYGFVLTIREDSE